MSIIWYDRIHYCNEGECDGHDKFENIQNKSQDILKRVETYDYSSIVIVINKDDVNELEKFKIVDGMIFYDDDTMIVITEKMFAKFVLCITSYKTGYRVKHAAYSSTNKVCTNGKRFHYVYGITSLKHWLINSCKIIKY